MKRKVHSQIVVHSSIGGMVVRNYGDVMSQLPPCVEFLIVDWKSVNCHLIILIVINITYLITDQLISGQLFILVHAFKTLYSFFRNQSRITFSQNQQQKTIAWCNG